MLMLLATCYSLLVPGYIMKHEKHVILALNTVLRPLSLSLSLSTKFCPLDRGRPFFFLVLVQNFDARGHSRIIKLISLLCICMVNRNKRQKNNKTLFI